VKQEPIQVVRVTTGLPEPMRDRFERRAGKTGVRLSTYLRIVLSRVDREMQEEEASAKDS